MSEVPKNTEETGLSQWELALYVGVPVAALCLAGFAYYYMSRNKDNDEKEEKDPEAVPEGNESEKKEEAPKEKVSLYLVA